MANRQEDLRRISQQLRNSIGDRAATSDALDELDACVDDMDSDQDAGGAARTTPDSVTGPHPAGGGSNR